AGLDPGEASEVLALDGHRNTNPSLAPEHLHHGVARLTVDLDAGCRLERLSISASRSLCDDVHVKLHRGGVGMDLNNPDLGAVLGHVFVARQDLRLVCLDE